MSINNVHTNLKIKYKRILEISFILSLTIIITMFYSFKSFKTKNALNLNLDREIFIVAPPITEQHKPRPRPDLPRIPVPADEDDLLDDVTIPDTDINFADLNTDIAPPPLMEEEEFPFYAVSEKPVLIKKITPKFPNLAIRAGIEGTVVIKALIDKKGNIEKVELLKSIPMLDQAAIAAAMQFKYKPGKQRDRFVKVWVSIPFRFYFKSN